MKCNTFEEDKCCTSCFDSEGTKILNAHCIFNKLSSLLLCVLVKHTDDYQRQFQHHNGAFSWSIFSIDQQNKNWSCKLRNKGKCINKIPNDFLKFNRELIQNFLFENQSLVHHPIPLPEYQMDRALHCIIERQKKKRYDSVLWQKQLYQR